MKLVTIILSILILAGCMAHTASDIKPKKVDRPQDKNAESQPMISRPAPAPMVMPPRPMPSAPVGQYDRKPQVLAMRESATDTAFNQLFSASLAFAMIEKANIKDTIDAQLLIDTKKELDELKKELTVSGPVTSKTVKVTKIVVAKLEAPDFEIIKATPEEQAILPGSTTEWNWTLQPKTPGIHPVSVNVTAIVKVNGRETTHSLKSFSKKVDIEITDKQLATAWLEDQYKWLFTTFIIPLLIWWYKERTKKKE